MGTSVRSAVFSLAAVVLLPAQVLALDYSNYSQERGSAAANVTTFERQGKKVVLIPMVHISTKTFYKGVRRELDKYVDQNAVILEEGVTVCGGAAERTAWVPGETFDASSANAILAASKESEALPDELTLRLAGFRQRVCQKEPRPGRVERFKDRYFSTYSLIGALFLLRSQGTVRGLYPRNVDSGHGDIVGSHLVSPVDQIVFNSLVDCFEEFVRQSGSGRCGRVVAWLKSSVDTESYIVGLRNQVLMAKLLRSLGLETSSAVDARYEITDSEIGGSHDVAILPWGSAHFVENGLEFPRELEERGFVSELTGKVRIASCSRVRRNPLLRETTDGVCN